METIRIALFTLVVAFVALLVTMQVLIRMRARALTGKPLPPIPGVIGKRIASSKRALVYFFSPQCAACRAITPRVREIGKTNDSVFAIDVSQNLDVARALGVMATPSTVEVEDGRVVGFHVGMVPPEVFARFA